jgi:phosphoheptose isomerase
VTPTSALDRSGADEVIVAATRAVEFLAGEVPRLRRWASAIVASLDVGGMVLTAGNGGSATHASHLASELIGRFRQERPPLRAVSLTTDGSVLTALGNDYGFEEVFARQIAGLASPKDVIVLFSTSGRSPDVVRACRAGQDIGATVFAVTGPAGDLGAMADDALCVPGADTACIQDAHHVAVHGLCAEIDRLVTRTGGGA